MSYKLIKKIFSRILIDSKTIQGRIYFTPRHTAELNTGELEQHIASPIGQKLKNGPLVAILPPISFGSHRDGVSTWTKFILTFYFLRTSSVDENGNIRFPSPMRTTQVTVVDDWDSMHAVAKDVLRIADKWFKEGLINSEPALNIIRFKAKSEDTITPESFQGNDRWSGVKVVTQVEINEDCVLHEFTDDQINSLINQNLIL